MLRFPLVLLLSNKDKQSPERDVRLNSERTVTTTVYSERIAAGPYSTLRVSYSLGSILARGQLYADEMRMISLGRNCVTSQVMLKEIGV
jgi:hypothetical protein